MRLSLWESIVGFFGVIAAMIIALGMLVILVAGVLFMTCIWTVAWTLGMKIGIREEGKLIGWYRWFTFHRK